MKEKIDNILKNKYNEIETKININTDEIINELLEKERKNKINISFLFKMVACFSIVLLLSFGIYYYNNVYQNTNSTPNSLLIGESKGKENKQPITKLTIESVENNSNNAISIGKEIPDCIVIVKIDKILGYTNYSEKIQKYTGPTTNYKATILETLKYNNDTKKILNNNIEFFKYGGTVLISDYEKILPELEKERLGFNSMSTKYKQETYINVVYDIDKELPELIEGKVYLIFLKNDNYYFDKLYITRKYGIMEYDTNTQKVKNNITNVWEDINLYNF